MTEETGTPSAAHRCRWCGSTYNEHEDSRPPNAPQPRMPCLGLKANFLAREPKPIAEPEMIAERPWSEFVDAGLFWWVNRGLHLFGWALVREVVDGKVVRVYPARCRFRGFSGDVETAGFHKLTRHIQDRIPELLADTTEGS